MQDASNQSFAFLSISLSFFFDLLEMYGEICRQIFLFETALYFTLQRRGWK